MLLKDSFNFLAKCLFQACSQSAVITRGTETLFESAPCVLATQEFENTGSNGQRYTTYNLDIMFKGELGYAPVKGDKIVTDGTTYLVRALDNEVYRYDDVYKTVVRVHVIRVVQ